MPPLIGITDIASYVPARTESNLDKLARFGMTESFVRDKIGALSVARKEAHEETSDLCVKAFHALCAKQPVDPATIDCLVVCTQNPDGAGIPHTSAVVHGKLNAAESAACFDISLGCSGFVYALSIAQSFMQANGLKRGLLFTADPYSKIIDPDDKSTVLLFGDAAAVALIETSAAGASQWRAVRFAFGTRGKEGMALHNTGGKLQMDGRAVFGFSATVVPAQVNNLLADAGLAASDIDLFLFHQGSKYIVDTIAQRLALPREKVLLGLADCGNTVSSSVPLLLEKVMHEPNIRRVLLSGFGVGLSWASCILERDTVTEPAR